MKSKTKKTFLFAKEIFIAISLFFLLFLLFNSLYPVNDSLNFSTLITDKKGNVVHAFLNDEDKWRFKTDLQEINPDLEKAFLFKEDKYFYYHPGVNPFAIIRAGFNNAVNNKRTSGASTITMQVARLLSPKERTYTNKLLEIFRAFQLEWKFSKKEILQLYFNTVPYGGNIEGVKSASVFYFDKLPDRLSLAEITALTIIPNRPNSLFPGKNNQQLLPERNKWLERFAEAELFPQQELEQALHEPIEGFRHSAIQFATQYSIRLKNNFPNEPLIKTTLNLQLQHKLQEITRSYMSGLSTKKIHNAAVLVINNQTMEVEAYIASNDFKDTKHGGQIDGIVALRSPGSTLKPLLFADAFSKGILTPKTIINDVPANFSGYHPENYDGRYYGPVSVEFALANSLNVPAVKTLEKIGFSTFSDLMIKAGYKSIETQKKDLGLSLILGGCGVTLEEVTQQYTAFANRGKLKGIRYLQADSTFQKEIISEESAYMTSEILIDIKRPDLPYQWQQIADLPKIAWKTGTSYGRRDAWSVGYNNNYTIGVWVGNFSGEGVPEILGAEIAGPLLFKVFNAIEKSNNLDWFTQPEDLDFRMVCEKSGKIPDENCRNLIVDAFIPGISSMEKCIIEQQILTDPKSHISYCKSCLPNIGYKKNIYDVYPPEVINWQRYAQININELPPHNPDCERVFSENAPKIVSPDFAEEYFVDPVDSTNIMLKALVPADVKKLFWYVNDKFLASEVPEKPIFYFPPKGTLKISCTDDKGRNSNIKVQINYSNF